MCQFSARDGLAQPWHLQHLGQYAFSGAALVMIESTAVSMEGRITGECLALCNDAQEEALGRVLDHCRSVGGARFGIQLAHAGRKGACEAPWKGGGALPAERTWTLVAPSALPYDETRARPEALGEEALGAIRAAYAGAARRAARLNLDAVELHAAHGYLLHSFLSPITNRREDTYGGSAAARMRFPLEVAADVRAAWPSDRILGARLNCGDMTEGGADIADVIAFARHLKRIGYDYVCLSCGSLYGGQKIHPAPGYLLDDAARIRAETGLITQAAGLIFAPQQAEAAIASGRVDMVAIARAFLDDPRWVWHAAQALSVEVGYPPQYSAVRPQTWPWSGLVRRAGE